MRQILTIFWDSYRLLTAKKLFWVALGLSVLIGLIYASISFHEEGMSVFFGAYTLESGILNTTGPLAKYIYLTMFTDVLVPFWLGLFAIVLALLSVCPVFPNFLEGGSIDIAVSKPISRVTLFVSKYLSSLLFVAIQVFVFSLIVFVAFGLRMESWNFGIFWAVPLMVFVFSLIYCVAVLTAVWTKSTLLSLLMAFLVWGVSWGIQVAEGFIYRLAYTAPASGLTLDMGTGQTQISDEPQAVDSDLAKFHGLLKMVETPLPKTREATYLLKKKIKIDGRNLTQAGAFIQPVDDVERNQHMAEEDYDNRHSEFFVVGTSLAFELVILSIAGFFFVRKDY
ncbi:ABC transporter permease [Verrucomicrobiaceae bacterium 5K15]|uniref:ABC transporter permease n=1 Tax=Oceaniferula flava TaxID=2800421 RepID=A0AAE2VCH5_9BACT|nr:hypothetical protein [Oceaniferula flavus]MBK1853439.1 ABC transporter permease [Oceaniferula flavus]MBM1134744.1 ABC transporter permease [Oceaniferula flavus]